MAIRDFTASVRMIFKDEFSAQADSARASLGNLTSGLNEMASGSSALQTASQLSLVAGHAERMSQSISQAMEAPSDAASKLESALAAASTVVTPELAIDGDFDKTMDYLRSKALDWASGTTEGSQLAEASADKYAKTTYNMLSAGLKAEAAVNATEQALLLAKATMGDSADAASLLAVAYNTMGDKSKDSRSEMQRLSDVVAKTQAAFQIADLTQLNNGLKYGIPAAQKYKVAWAEMSTVIGQLNTSGLTDSMAGTSFSSMMSQMIKGQQKLGFKIEYNEDGSMSVIGTLNNIRDKFGEVDSWNERTISAFNTVFGERGSRALTLLLTGLD
ncbi:MAG: phage tail tape measure protein, partial [Spirochaetales bacterium]|nr:phage tail tape measure protein [Spirochaetales bacterium]